MMKIKYLLLMLLLIPMVMGYSYTANIPSGETHKVIGLTGCVGDYQMKIRGVNEFIEDEFWFPGCYLGEEFYECNCDKTNKSVWIYTKPEAVNEYDIVVQYYISNIRNDANKRVININDAPVGPYVRPLNELLPNFDTAIVWITIIVISILAIIGFILILLWKWVFDSEENQIDQFTEVDHDKVVQQGKKIDNIIKVEEEKEDNITNELQNILDDLD